MIVVTNLHNPSGVLASDEALATVGALASARGARVLVDEVYLDAATPRPRSSVHLGPEFVAASSLTKVYGLSGLRCGWILADAELAERIWRLNDLFVVNRAHADERLACIAFEQIDAVLGDSAALLQRNRSLFNRFLAQRDDLECAPAEHGLTAFPRWLGGDTERLDALLHERYDTAIVPGRWFEMPNHFRIGFGEPADDFAEGLSRLRSRARRPQMKRDEVFEFFRRLAEANPSPTTELRSTNPYTLLVAVVLSAQATDASVNAAMGPVFARRLRRLTRCSNSARSGCATQSRASDLFNTKAKNVILLSQALIDRFGADVPRDSRRAAVPPRRRPQDGQCRAQHRVRG